MLGQWRVQIITSPGMFTKRIYMFNHIRATGMQVLTRTGEIHLVKEGDKFDDDLYFAEMDDDQLQAFANAMAEKGVKTTNDAKNEGLLQATKAHLEDMRLLALPVPRQRNPEAKSH